MVDPSTSKEEEEEEEEERLESWTIDVFEPLLPASVRRFLQECFETCSGNFMRALIGDVYSYSYSRADTHSSSKACADKNYFDAVDIAAFLRSIGYDSRVVWTSEQDNRNKQPWSMVKHVFVLVRDRRDESGVLEAVVDPSFREQFEIPRASARYEEVMRVVPSTFVGPMSHMMCGAVTVCREMERSFRDIGMVVPPWRKTKNVLNRWYTSCANPPRRIMPIPLSDRTTTNDTQTNTKGKGKSEGEGELKKQLRRMEESHRM